MGLFNRRRPSIGLDIGSSHIKLMGMEHDARSDRHRLVNFGMAKLPPRPSWTAP